jgi:lipoprotein-anchoring transpeptidase ErfK/SrfK
MSSRLSRRDFLKLGGLSAAGLAFSPLARALPDFSDSNVVRVATTSVSVYNQPSDKSLITGTWYRDDLVHVYEEVVAQEPKFNPVWYRVWGGYMHRARLQRVKTILNVPLESIPQGTRRLGEVTIPFTNPWRQTKARGWEQLGFRLYYESVHWIDAVEEGPSPGIWYRIYDDLVGFPYLVPASHLRLIPLEDLEPISPDVPGENKRVEVNLTTQALTAFEYDKIVFQTNISSGVPFGETDTPRGKFNIDPKTPSKHMGNGNLMADADDYELPGVPWTSFFTEAGHAFHGTYWHENFGSPMSHGCINMRTNEARWLFRWVRPTYLVDSLLDASKIREARGIGTTVEIFY